MPDNFKKRAKVIPLHQPLSVEVYQYEQTDYENWDIYISVDEEPMILEDVTLMNIDGTRIDFGCDNVLHDTSRKQQHLICKHCQKPYSHPVCKKLNQRLNQVLQNTLNSDFALQLLSEAYQPDSDDDLEQDIEYTKNQIKPLFFGEDGENVVFVFSYENESYLFIDSMSDVNEELPPMMMKYDEKISELTLALEMMNPVILSATVDLVTDVFTKSPEKVVFIKDTTLKEIFLMNAYK